MEPSRGCWNGTTRALQPEEITWKETRVWFGLVSLFNGISTLCRLFNAKAILLEEQ